MSKRDRVLQTLAARRDTLLRLGVRRLGLFGSVARGDESAESDLDFLVDFETKSFDAYMDLLFLLQDLFGSKVDLVLGDALKPRLKPVVMRECVNVPGF